jgi:hypothetical protein
VNKFNHVVPSMFVDISNINLKLNDSRDTVHCIWFHTPPSYSAYRVFHTKRQNLLL